MRHVSIDVSFPQALSDFAEYVQKQQVKRGKQDGSAAASKPSHEEEHEELEILDQLGLADESSSVKLKHVLLDRDPATADDSVAQLSGYLDGRLLEGHGEALFDLGLEDNGDSMGFSREDWDFALERVTKAAADVNADSRLLMTRNVGGENEVGPLNAKDSSVSGKLVVRRRPESVDDVIETRIAVVGNVDAGKSTMLGVLVKGGLDDGRGKMRVNLFRHKHEIESGRTSSVGMEIMGFDSKGEVVSSTVPGRKLSWEEIGRRSVCEVDGCCRGLADFISAGQSHQLHRFGGPRKVPQNHGVWHAEQRAELLSPHGCCQQRSRWHVQV